IEDVHVSDAVGSYIVDLVTATRTSTSTTVGANPRGSPARLKAAGCKAALPHTARGSLSGRTRARCRAARAGRDFVTPEDVKAVAVPALAHRLMLKPELWVQRLRGEDGGGEGLEAGPT